MIKYFKKAVLVLACLLMGEQSVLAYDWVGNELSEVLAESKADEENPMVTDADRTNPAKTVFLYNVAKKKFLYQGESSGTHSIYSDIGIRCWIMKRQEAVGEITVDKYYIETACNNNQGGGRGNWLGNDEGNVRGPFVDMSPIAWEIEAAEAGSNKYYIHNANKDNVESYLYAYDTDRNVYREPQVTVEKHGGMEAAQWILVTEQDLLDEFNKTSIELGGVPADASFLLGDPDFHRYSAELGRWDWEPNGATLRVGIDNHYQAFTEKGACDSSREDNWNRGAGDWSGSDVENGKYWCAKINGGTGTLSQTVKLNKTGWYRVLCQGECYLKDATSHKNAFLFAKYSKDGKAQEAKQPLRMSSTVIERTSGTKGDFKNPEGKRYYDTYGDYTNTVMIYVDCGKDNSQEVELQLGVSLVDDGLPSGLGENDFGVAVDAFRLQYSGKPDEHELVLDEDFTDFDYITKETQKEYKNAILYFHRSFTLNCWNTIVLPVSLTADQFNTAFGSDSKLAYYEGVSNNRLQFKVQDDKKAYDTEEKGAFLKANTPYIIWPTAEAGQTQEYSYSTTYGNETTEQHEVKVGTPYYVVNDVTLDKTNVENTVVKGEVKDGYCFNGVLAQDYAEETTNFINDAHVKAGDYTFYAGKLHQFTNDYGMKGFRAWFTSETASENGAKPIGVEISGVQGDEVTGLDFVEASQNTATSSIIYNLRGQRMNAKAIDELPRGIYIVNHKKYVVK